MDRNRIGFDAFAALHGKSDSIEDNGSRKASLNLVRELLNASTVVAMPTDTSDLRTPPPTFVCWHCGCAMLILQTFTRGYGPAIRAPPSVHTQ